MTPHIALGRRAWIKSKTGVYKSRCDCQKYFASPIPGVPFRGKYSFEVRQVVADSIIRDRLPYRKVMDRLREDFHLKISVGYVHECFQWAFEQINTEERRQWAVDNFSGVLCIDEVHDSGRIFLYATDPLNDFTIHFAVNDVNDQEHMDRFLQELKDMGILPHVVITDGSPLYKDALQERWTDVEHQLCLFHVFKDVNQLLLDGLRSVKNKIKRQGNKGRKKKRGRPSKIAQRNRANQKRESRKEQAAFLWEHQHLIVKKASSMTDDEKDSLKKMISIAPEIKVLREFNQAFYRLFEKGIRKQKARYRRTTLVNKPEYQKNPYTKKAIKKIRKELFEKMIVFMDYDNPERTSNHVERNNRSFRMLQKTRYKRRTAKTITMAIELDLYAKMMRHLLFRPDSIIKLASYQSWQEDAA